MIADYKNIFVMPIKSNCSLDSGLSLDHRTKLSGFQTEGRRV